MLALSIFVNTSAEDQIDFYLVLGMTTSTLLLSFYTKKHKNRDSGVTSKDDDRIACHWHMLKTIAVHSGRLAYSKRR